MQQENLCDVFRFNNDNFMTHIKNYFLALTALVLTNYASAQDCTDIHFTLHSDVNNGGSPQVVYSVTDYPITMPIVAGQATYTSENSNFEFDLCLEDGCYAFTVDNNYPITLGQNIFLEITDGENNYMTDAQMIHQDAVSFRVQFCIGGSEPLPCQEILEAATLSFDVEEGTSAGQFQFSNTSSEIENVQWGWSFGDGQVASEATVTHTYTTAGTYQVCLIAYLQQCSDTVCETVVYEAEECDENPVHFNLHSDVSNGGSNQLIYSVWQEGNTNLITSGAAQYSAGNSNFEFDLCLPDGCYVFIVDNNHEIELGENVQLEIISNQTNLMTTATILHEDPVSFSIQFGVNSDCTVGVEEAKTNVFSLYPNPANDDLTIQSKGKSTIQSIEIIDAKGTLITAFNPNNTITTLSVNDLATGLYFVKITDKESVSVERIQVIR